MSETSVPTAPPAPVSLREAFWFWLKLGCIGFGGPAGQIAIMHRELVERRRWISEGRFLHALNYCMVLPGPEATQLAVYIGWLLNGTVGGVIAGVLFVLPGACLLTLLSFLFIAFGGAGFAGGILFGFKAAALALIVAAMSRIGAKSIRSPLAGFVAILSFVLMTFNLVPFPLILLGAGIFGWLALRLYPAGFPTPGKDAHGVPVPNASGPALIDDASPTPDHARVSVPRLVAKALLFTLLIGAPPLVLSLALGFNNTFAQMARLFTFAAFVTIGGAYAVLPYIRDMATETYGWLQPGQMMTGLALGETTPGPLILVLTFVGFVAGWNRHHADLGYAGALAGAGIATYCTFVPSFMFILLGGPFVERSRGEIRLGIIFAAISAAVVGVIANMAFEFGAHFFSYSGKAQPFEIAAAAGLTLAAFAAIQWKKVDAAPVVLASGAVGALLHVAGLIRAL